VNTFGAPFMLEGLFGEADAEAMDAEPELGESSPGVGMDVENEVAADGGMVVDHDSYVPSPPLDTKAAKKVD
jgi:hypothetical protein